MKKLLLLLFVASLGLTATSCKKDHVCECTIAGTAVPTTFANSSKSDAETACNNLQTQSRLVDPATTCVLK